MLMAGGNRVEILGNAKFSLKIGSLKTHCEASFIKTSPLSLILGMKFLRKYRVVIDLRNKFVTLESNTFRTKICLPSPEKQINKNKSKTYLKQ